MNPPDASRHRPPGLGRTIATAFIAQFVFSMVSTSPGVFAPVAAPDMGVGPHLVGVLYAIQAITGVVAGTASSVLFGRIGLIRSLQAGGLAIALSMLLGATGLPLLALGSGMLMGAALGPAGPAATYMLSRVAPPEKLNVLASIQQSGPPLGMALGGVVFPLLILALGWQQALLVTAVLGLAVAVYLEPMRARMDRLERSAGFSLASFAHPIRLAMTASPRLRHLALATPLFGVVHAGQIAFLVVYLNVEMGRPLVLAGLALTGSQLGAVVGRIFWGWLADRRRDPFLVMAMVAFGAAVGALVLAVYPKEGPDWPLFLLSIAYGGVAAGWQGVVYASAARFAPAGQVVAATAGVQFFMFAGGIGGPLLIAGIVALVGNYATAYVALTFVALALAAQLLAARRSAR